MKIFLTAIFALGLLGLAIYAVRKPNAEQETVKLSETVQSESSPTLEKNRAAENKMPVLVELFTSEGCSSCPPADKNLIYLNEKQPVEGAEIIALELHVDYWNRLGWADPFSNAEYSARQENYSEKFKLDGVYTPQIVVDGAKQFVGGNLNEAEKNVGEAIAAPKAKIELNVAANNKLRVKISDLPKIDSAAKVFLAVAEDKLSTAVSRGENGGRTLSHTAVVRELKTIGQITAGDREFTIETVVQTQPVWKRENLELVIFVQDEQTSRIIGVRQTRL